MFTFIPFIHLFIYLFVFFHWTLHCGSRIGLPVSPWFIPFVVCVLSKKILFAFEADGTKTREACRPRHRNAEKHQRLFSNPNIPAVFIYSQPPNPKPSPDFHDSAEKEHPLVVVTVPRQTSSDVFNSNMLRVIYSSLQTVKMWRPFDSLHSRRIISSSACCRLSDRLWLHQQI